MPKWWIQADCALIDAADSAEAMDKYRALVAEADIACQQNQHCAALRCLALTNRNAYEHRLARAGESTHADIS